MSKTETGGNFIIEGAELLRDYAETRARIWKLQAIRRVAKTIGSLAWMMVSLFLTFLFFVFAGLTTGFWLSSVTGSYTTGFVIATGIIVIVIFIFAILRRVIFVNPLIRMIIRNAIIENDKKEDAKVKSNRDEQPN